MKTNLILSLAVSTLALVSCGEIIKGNGNVAEVSHSLESFDEIDISGMYEIELVQGENSLEVITDENLHEHIKFDVRDGVLHIDSDNKQLEAETLLLRIHYVNLQEVEVSGAVELTAADVIQSKEFEFQVSGACDATLELDVDVLDVEISGGGEMELSGRADKVDISISGAGEINAKDLRVLIADIGVTGAGEIDLDVAEQLNVDITGAGEVNYTGNPSVKQSITGAGSVEKRRLMRYPKAKAAGLLPLVVFFFLIQTSLSQEANGRDIRNLSDGFHTIYWENGSKYYGDIFNGEFSGKGNMVWPDSSFYEGSWQDGMRHGKGYMRWNTGREYEGRWKEDEPHGKGQMEWPNGQVYRGKFQDGKMHGKGQIRYSDGTVWKGEFLKGKAQKDQP